MPNGKEQQVPKGKEQQMPKGQATRDDMPVFPCKTKCHGECHLIQYKFTNPDDAEWFDNTSVDPHWVKAAAIPADEKADYDRAKKLFREGFSLGDCDDADCACKPNPTQPGSSSEVSDTWPPWGQEETIEIGLHCEIPGAPGEGGLKFYRCRGKLRRLQGYCAPTRIEFCPK